MKEDTLYRWRGWLLGAAIITLLLVLMVTGAISLDGAMGWVEKLFDKISG